MRGVLGSDHATGLSGQTPAVGEPTPWHGHTIGLSEASKRRGQVRGVLGLDSASELSWQTNHPGQRSPRRDTDTQTPPRMPKQPSKHSSRKCVACSGLDTATRLSPPTTCSSWTATVTRGHTNAVSDASVQGQVRVVLGSSLATELSTQTTREALPPP